MRAVIDPNVFVSAYLNVGGTPAKVLAAADSGWFRIVASPDLIAEVDEVLHRHKFRARIDPQLADQTVLDLRRTAEIHYPDPPTVGITRDADDDYLVQLARQARADVLVTGDRDLLDDTGIPDVRVVTPRQFLTELVEEL